MSFNANELNNRVTVEAEATGQDPATGFATTDWLELTQIWAKVEPFVGRAAFEADRAGIVRPTRITTRWNDTIRVAFDDPTQLAAPPSPYDNWTGALRFKWQDLTFNAYSVDDIQGKRREMLITAKTNS